MAGPCIRNDVFIDCCRKKYSPTQNSIMDSVLTNSDVALQFGTMPTGSNKHDIVTQFNEWARDSIEKGHDKTTAMAFYENLSPGFKNDSVFQSLFPVCFDMEWIKKKKIRE